MIFLWSTLTDGSTITTFNPSADVLSFDDASISASDFGMFTWTGSDAIFSVGGKANPALNKTVHFTITGGGRALTDSNVTYLNGSKLLIGDNTTNVGDGTSTFDDLANLLTGASGGDRFIGLGGDDTMVGGGGNDTFVLNNGANAFGNDSVVGGAGQGDAIGVGNHPSILHGSTVDFSTHMVTSVDGTAVFSGIESAFGTSLADTFIAIDSSRLPTGLGASNGLFDYALSLRGYAGNDSFTGDSRAGYFELVTYSDAPNAVVVNLATGTASDGYDSDTVTGGIQPYTDTLVNIDAVQGSAFNDLLTAGGTGTFTGNGTFFQQLEGMGGNDTLDANGAPNVRVEYLASPAGVVVNLATGTASDGWGATDTLLGSFLGVRGSNFDDSITGNASNNFLEGRGGNDFLDGGAGTDSIYYQSATSAVNIDLATGTSSITGGQGTDIWVNVEGVRGGDFNDTLRGDGGNNTLEGRAGNDLLDGRTGTDLVRYDFSLSAVNMNLATGIALDGYDSDSVTGGIQSYIDTLVSIERVRGSLFDDTITGSAGDDFFEGWAGSDTLEGGSGGSDTAEYGNSQGAVIVNLATGTALDGWDSDSITGGIQSYTDTLISIENASGSNFNDVLVGDAGANSLSGGGGNDTLAGGAGDDILNGGIVADLQSFAGFSDTDRADYSLAAGPVNVNLTTGIANDGSGGVDTLSGIENVTGSAFADLLTGSAAFSENFGGGAGNDTIDGGLFNDRAEYANATAGITVNMTAINPASGTVTGNASVGIDTLINVEQVQGTGFADTYVATGFLSSSAPGGVQSSFNEFEGGAGDDTITGNGGTRVSYLGAAEAVNVNLTTGIAVGGASVGTDTFDGVNQARGSAFNDTLTGGNAVNNNFESFEGRGGDDLISGGGGFDRADYGFGGPLTVGITVNLAAGTVVGDPTFLGTDTLSSIEAVRGSFLNDVYDATGFSGASTNAGSNGTFNEFEGMAGNDLITGNGNTRLSFGNAREAVTVNIATGTASGGASVGTDSFTGVNSASGSSFGDSLFGDANANTLYGMFGDDTLVGNTGNDTLIGWAGNDSIDGGTGTDLADYSSSPNGVVVNLATGTASDGWGGTDTLTSIENVTGSAFDDSIVGDGNANSLSGGAGNDTLVGGLGQDTLIGGAGNDSIDGGTIANVATDTNMVSYSTSASGVVVDLINGTAQDGLGGTDTLVNINWVIGSAFNDTLTGQNGGLFEQFEGGAGDDTIDAGTIDTLVPSYGNRAVYQNAGSAVTVDLAAGTATGGGQGNDTLVNINQVRGSAFGDSLFGSDATLYTEQFEGRGGNDTIDGRGGADRVYFQTSPAGVTVDLSAGTATDGFGGTDTLFNIEHATGTTFNDSLLGDSGANRLDGDAGNDVLAGLGGNDTLLGGGGNDTLRLGNGASAFGNDSVDGGAGLGDNIGVGGSTANGSTVDFNTHMVTSVDGTATFSNIEGAFGTDFADTFISFEASRVLTGLGNSNGDFDFARFLQGFAGNDFFIGDSRDGYSEQVTYSTAPNGVVVNLATGLASDGYDSDTLTGGVQPYTDTLMFIDGVQGSMFNDLLIGGGTGTVFNGVVVESFEGLAGNDTINANGMLFDRVTYLGAPSGVTVNLATGMALDGYDSDTLTGGIQSYTDTLIGITGVTGSNFDDSIIGDANGDYFEGRGGNDYFDGGAGADRIFYTAATSAVNIDLATGTSSLTGGQGTDTWINIEGARGGDFNDTLRGDGGDNSLEGRAGADLLDGRSGNDLVRYDFSLSAVNVNLATGTALDGYDSDSVTGGIQPYTDTLVSIEAVRGSKFDDAITGNASDNNLEGWAGNDTLTGGAGNDAFIYSTPAVAGNADRITDFQGGADVLRLDVSQLSGLFFDLNGPLDPSRFTSGAGVTATTAAQRILYDTATGDLSYDADGTGGAAAVKLFTLAGAPTVSASDIVVFNGATHYLWSSLTHGQVIAFDPTRDVLRFDDPAISAASLGIDGNDGEDGPASSIFTHNGKTVTLSVSPLTLTTTNVSFDDGSVLMIGDNTTGVVNDDAANTLVGGAGDDLLLGAEGADSVSGGAGDDRLAIVGGIYGDDTIDGGSGNDTLHYFDDEGFGVNVDLATGIATGGDGIPGSTLTLAGIENVIGTEMADSLTGDGAANLLEGGAGNDTLDGAAGIDTAEYGSSPNGVTVNLGAGTASDGWDSDTLIGGIQPYADKLVAMENVVGSAFNDSLVGDGNANVLEGGAGNDVVVGMGGNDTLLGGSGNDTFRLSNGASAFGNDSVDGGAGLGDNIGVGTDAGTLHGATVDFTTHVVTSVDGTATFTNIEGAFGTNFADTFIAFDPTRVLGGLGNPNGNFDFTRSMQGFAGADSFTGDSRAGYFEQVTYSSAPSGVVVNLATGVATDGYDSDTLAGGVQPYTDTLVDIDGVQGSAFADLLMGGGPATTFSGTHFEQFEGLAGNDTIDANLSANDRAAYFSAPNGVVVNLATGTALDGYDSDTLTGGVQSYTDTLIGIFGVSGSNFNDSITGDANNNFFDGRGGNDYFDGGAGSDQIFYSGATSAVDIDLATGTSSLTGGQGTDIWVNVEAVRGGDFNDTLRGADDVDNNLEGLAGADLLDGRTGTDLVRYERSLNAVNVNLVFGTATDGYDADSVTGGVQPYTDTLVSIERVRGSKFDDTVTGDANNNGFEGWAGNDTLDGGAGFDTAEYFNSLNAVTVNLALGTASDGWGTTDTLISIEGAAGSAFNDTLTGDAGDNFLRGGLGADVLDGGAGADYADYRNATSGLVVDLNSPGNNTGEAVGDSYTSIERIRGGNFNDTLVGDAGDNALRGGLGADRLDGGAGIDFASYSDATAGIVADLGHPANNTGEAIGDVYISIEALRGGNFNDTLTGGAGDNFLQGGPGADLLVGGVGDGDDDDIADYVNAATGVVVDLANPGNNTGEAAGDSYVSINGIRGGAFNDTLTGDAGFNILDGGLGADRLDGGADLDLATYQDATSGVIADLGNAANNTGEAAGDTFVSIEAINGSGFNDTLRGNAGDNILIGSDGADVLEGGAGSDYAGYFESATAVVVDLGTPVNNTGEAAGDSYVSIENIAGSDFADTLTGDAGNNYLMGNDGADVLNGGAGLDVADYMFGDAVLVDLGNAANNTGEAAGDTYNSIEGIRGGDFNDSLVGDGGDNLLIGGAGNDTLDGGAGADTMVGGSGDDTYYVDNFGDVVIELADEGFDTVVTTGQIDIPFSVERIKVTGNSLAGNTADNVIEGVAIAQSLDGGGGSDTVSYAYQLKAVTVDLAAGTATELDDDDVTVVDTLTSFENAIGGQGDDTLIGSGAANLLDGSGGADSMAGGLGADIYVVDDAGDDVIETDNDLAGLAIAFNLASNVDTILASINYILGNFLEILRQAAGSGNLVGTGNELSNLLVGNEADNALSGAAGDDELDGGAGADTLDGGDGADTAVYSGAASSVAVSLAIAGVQATGGGGNDVLIAIENLLGSAFNDTLAGDGGDNVLNGGAGLDTANYANAGSAVTVSLAIAGVQATGGAGGDSLVNFENLAGSAFGDTLTGNSGANTLDGGAGDDSMSGGSGNDQVLGGLGNDVLHGNVGADTLSGDDGNDQLLGDNGNDTIAAGSGDDNVNGNNGFDTVDGGAGNDTIHGGTEFDVLSGGDGDDLVAGDKGNDTMDGGVGNDNVLGAAGNDWLVGGAGNDVLDGGTEVDTADYGNASGAAFVDLSSGTASDGWGFTDTLIAIENVSGSGWNDTLSGNVNANVLNAGAGDDSILGGGGNDLVQGGDGDDVLHGNVGADTVAGDDGDDQLLGDNGNDTIAGGLGNDNINGNNGFDTVDGGAGNDTIHGGTEADVLSGGDGDDQVFGDRANDTLDGGAGDDTLIGGIGNDVMDGGSGNDLFRYDATNLNTTDVAANGSDVINGAVTGDLISMLGLNDDLAIGGTALNALSSNAMVGGALSVGTSVAFTGGVLEIDVNGDGAFSAANDFQITLTGVTTVTYNATDDLFHLS